MCALVRSRGTARNRLQARYHRFQGGDLGSRSWFGGGSNTENFFDLRSELGWRWINDEVIEAVIVKTIRRMPRYTFKMQFQDTFAWMICLNSLFFLGERQPTVMKYVWELKKHEFLEFFKKMVLALEF